MKFDVKRQKMGAALLIVVLVSISFGTLYVEKRDLQYRLLRQDDALTDIQRSLETLQAQYATFSGQDDMYYTGNPFATELWSGQLQAENITGMHWYSYNPSSGLLVNRTDWIVSLVAGSDINLASNDLVGATWVNGTNFKFGGDVWFGTTNITDWLVEQKALQNVNMNSFALYGATWLNSSSMSFSDEFWYGSSNRTDMLAYPSMPYSYEISKSGTSLTYTSAKNGRTGQIDWNMTDASTVIQAALNNLTSGRTWKENVVLKGDFTLNTQLTMPNYTIFDASKARLILKDAFNDNAIGIEGKTDVELYLGELDGNKANQGAGQYSGVLTGANSKRIKIYGYIKNCKYSGLYLSALSDFEVNAEVEGSGADGITIYNNCYNGIVQADSHNNGEHGIWLTGYNNAQPVENVQVLGVYHDNVHTGVYVDAYSKAILVDAASYKNGYGFIVAGQFDGEPYYLTRNVKLRGVALKNTIWGVELDYVEEVDVDVISSENAGYGIYVVGSKEINIKGQYNRNTGTSGHGVFIEETSRNVRIDAQANYNAKSGFIVNAFGTRLTGLAKNNGQAAIGDGMVISGASCILQGVYAFDDQITPTQRYGINVGAVNVKILGGYVYNNTDGQIVTDGFTPEIKGVIGFVTENSGTATIANNEYVAHSLAGTPTTVTLTPRAVTYGTPAVTFVVGVVARNSTHFRVGAYWTNGTAITTDAIVIDWIAYYVP